MAGIPPRPEDVRREWERIRDEETLLYCKAEGSLGGYGELLWTTHRIIYEPSGLASVIPSTSRSRTARHWDRGNVILVEICRGQPFPFSLRTVASFVANFLVIFSFGAILTLGVMPIKWTLDRVFGTHITIRTEHEKVWFYLKSVRFKDADQALSVYTSYGGR